MPTSHDPPPLGALTDVPGVQVGHHQRTGRGWQTGTTVVVVPGGAAPGVAVRGGGPGTRETDALAPGTLVSTIHALCFTGGSAYGLAAADGVIEHLEARGLGFPVGAGAHEVVPVVPTAVIFDLGRGGSFTNRPGADFGARAARRASAAPGRWGAVGAGTGARAGGLQGGVGTASTVVPIRTAGATTEVVVAALAVVNANGSAVDPTSGRLWCPDGLGVRRPSTSDRTALRAALTGQAAPARGPAPPGLNTTIGVVATSARLHKAEVDRIASVAHDGMARAIRPAHSMVDGDTVFGLATGEHLLPPPPGPDDNRSAPPRALDDDAAMTRIDALNALLSAAADSFAGACAHAVVAARTIGAAPSYRELCPSAVPPEAT